MNTEPASVHSVNVEQHVELRTRPLEGVPPLTTTASELAKVTARFAAGSGAVGVDAERASGYRYGQRAYLVQLRREGAGTALIDPIALPDLSGLNEAIADSEWVVHAATQDLTCLAEVGLSPTRLFDTELAGRLLGDERVALGTMVQARLGIRLEKGHSAADWSTRPLPEDWLSYAALDVELLAQLREVLRDELVAAQKLAWAEQEFAAELLMPPPVPREDRWRRTSGIHRVSGRRALAAVRELWTAREEWAAAHDVAPGRVLPDSAIVSAVRSNAITQADLLALSAFSSPRQRRNAGRWVEALARARALPERDLPLIPGAADAVPPASRWRDRDPSAAQRLARLRAVVNAIAEDKLVLAQNLMAGDVLRRLAWQPPGGDQEGAASSELVAGALADLGARPWQIELCAQGLAEALVAPPSPDRGQPDTGAAP